MRENLKFSIPEESCDTADIRVGEIHEIFRLGHPQFRPKPLPRNEIDTLLEPFKLIYDTGSKVG